MSTEIASAILIPRRFISWTALLLLSISPAAAQSRSIAPKARALLFQVHSNLTPASFGGATIAMKWHSDSTAARRLALTVDGDLIFSDERSRQVLQLDGEFLRFTYTRSRTPVYLYRGVGPTAGFRFGRQEIGNLSDTSVEAHIGAAGALGVEWLVTSSIGLLAEYHGALVLTFGRREPAGREDFYEYGLRIDSRGARAGVSVYF